MNASSPVSPATPAPLSDLPAAVDLIAEITGATTSEVNRRLRLEHASLGSNVREEMKRFGVQPYAYGPAMEKFYAETDAFLYETFTWNRYHTKQNMRQWIVSFLQKKHSGPLRVLAFGDGLGFDAVGLAMAGHQVTYFEVGQRSISFAKKIFAMNSTHVEVSNNLDELPFKSFDVIICLDVLEHVPNPPSLVGKLTEFLRPGGYFIAHAPFWFLHPAVSTHLAENQTYSGDLNRLYKPLGLTAVDGAIAWNPIALEKTSKPSVRMLTRIKLWCGGLLLKFARWWNWPLITLLRIILALEHRKLLKKSFELEP